MPTWFRDGGSIKGDAIIATAALAIALIAMAVARESGWYPEYALGYVIVAVVTAMAWVSSRPFPVATLVVVGCIAALPAWSFPFVEVRCIPLIVVAYRAAASGARARIVVPIVAVTGAATLLHAEIALAVEVFVARGRTDGLREIGDPSTTLLLAFLVASVVAAGYAIHAQRRSVHQLREQNAQLVALQAAERDRMVADLRTAIARDVHDVVAHHVSAMVIRAQAADRLASENPDVLREAVRAVVSDGREALTAMRDAVRLLRSDGTPEPTLLPDFGVAMTEMVDRVRASGREVEIIDLPAPSNEFAQATVMRIVQEALTNVMLHSDAQHVSVVFAGNGSEIEVVIEDNGSPAASPPRREGNGIRGIQERARAAGGHATSGPAPGGGWRVHAVIPHARLHEARNV